MWAMPATLIQLPCDQAADTPDISAEKWDDEEDDDEKGILDVDTFRLRNSSASAALWGTAERCKNKGGAERSAAIQRMKRYYYYLFRFYVYMQP